MDAVNAVIRNARSKTGVERDATNASVYYYNMKRNFNKQQPSGPSFDVVLKLLELSHELRPESPFISSLLMQYRERGGLSKKQLEGLHSKASKRHTGSAPGYAGGDHIEKTNPAKNIDHRSTISNRS